MARICNDALRNGRGTGSALARRAGATGRESRPNPETDAMMKIALMVHAGFALGLAAGAMVLV